MGDFTQRDYAPRVRDVPVPEDFLYDTGTIAECGHDEHTTYATDRLLREGNRVTVAVVADDRDQPFQVAELRCLHCPLAVDHTELFIDWSTYEEPNVIIAEATLSPAESGDGFILTDPYVVAGHVPILGL